MKCRLGDLARVSSSKRIYAKEYIANGIPFYRGKEIIELGSGRLLSNKLFISKDRFNQIRSKYDDVPEKNDVLITAVGTIGETYLVKSRDLPFYFKDGNLIKLSKWNRQIVLPEYMYYWLNSYAGKMAIKKITIGSTQQAITIRALSDVELDLPPISEQGKIAQGLSTLDFSIDNNKHINANLTNQLNSMFDKMYYESSSRIELMNFVSEMKSGDWGKAKLTDNFIKPAVIIRGTDFCNVANGQKSDAPIRYLKTATIHKKHLIANDVLIEISGGSPTQSTGRSLLITDKLLNRYNTPVLGTNFTRLFRCETEENAVLFHSYINFLYNKNVFFNYENGTTGIKNLDYKSILKINVNDVQKHSLFPKYFSMYHFYESMKQHLGDESTVLTCLKEQLLRKFF